MIPHFARLALGISLSIAAAGRPAWARGDAVDAVAVAPDAPPKPAEPKEIALEVSRQALPTPPLRYRFLPTVAELNPGNAAPVYLRLDQQTALERVKESTAKAVEWLNLPLAGFPAAEAGKLVEGWAGRLRQIEFGTRRRGCDWDYTILEERDNPFFILLPDAQAMRGWGRLIALKARVEVAAGEADRAIRTLGTGVAFGRHVAEGPFLINRLIGIAIIGGILDEADELIGRPGTPNLYWALAALPRPLVGMVEAVENERASIGRTLTGQLFEEIDLARPRSAAEWSAVLADLHARMVRSEAEMGPASGPIHATIPDLAAYRAAMLPAARAYLEAHRLAAASDDQALALAIVGLYRELADENSKLAYIPYPDALKLRGEVVERVKAAKAGPALSMALLLPAVESALLAGAKLDRKVAALRVVEALRLHAAEHDGQLPAALDEIEAVPVPPDPMTGRPFEYRRDGAAAVLVGASASPAFRLTYRIAVRP